MPPPRRGQPFTNAMSNNRTPSVLLERDGDRRDLRSPINYTLLRAFAMRYSSPLCSPARSFSFLRSAGHGFSKHEVRAASLRSSSSRTREIMELSPADAWILLYRSRRFSGFEVIGDGCQALHAMVYECSGLVDSTEAWIFGEIKGRAVGRSCRRTIVVMVQWYLLEAEMECYYLREQVTNEGI